MFSFILFQIKYTLMSFGGLGGGLIGGALAGMMGSAMDAVLGDNDIALTPIPAFYFEVLVYDTLEVKAITPPPAEEGGGTLSSMGANALASAKSMIEGPNLLKPGENDKEWWKKAFIEVSGIELGVETSSKNYGGDNFPIDLPTTMKNPHVNLKRLVRPQLLYKEGKKYKDDWNQWIEETLYSMAYWNTPVKTKYVQINVMHPNLKEGGEAYILKSINLEGAYPCKVSYSGLNSTSEDLLVQEIEVSYRNIHIEDPTK